MGEPHLDEPVVSKYLRLYPNDFSGAKEGNSKLTSPSPILPFLLSLPFDEGRVDNLSPLKLKPKRRLKMERMKILLGKRSVQAHQGTKEESELTSPVSSLPSLHLLSSSSLPKLNDHLDDPPLFPLPPQLLPSPFRELARRSVAPGRGRSSPNLPNRSRRRASPRRRSTLLCLRHRHLLLLRRRSLRRSTERALR